MQHSIGNTARSLAIFRKPRPVRLFGRALRLSSWANALAILLVVAAVVSGMATYAALSETPPFGNDPDTVIWLLNLDLIILLALIILVARRVVSLLSGRRRGVAGSRLHVRLVLVFSLLAAAPAILMTVFASFFLHFGMQSWFSDRVRTAVVESQAVAEAYLEEHKQVIRADILAMASDLDREAPFLMSSPNALSQVLHTQSLLRNFSETMVFDSKGRIHARSGLAFTLALEALPFYARRQADQGEVVITAGGADDRVRALVKLHNYTDSYLLVGRAVDPTVISHVTDTRKAAQEYVRLESQLWDLQVMMTMIFVVVALLLLLAAVWFGLMFARHLVMPISSMIAATDQVRAGDLNVRVPEFERGDEFDMLGRAFNRMTTQIQQQRNELITANRQLDQRRRFTETVLAGVSAGIVGVDEDGLITLANSSAAELFGFDIQELIGKRIADIIPQVHPLLEQAHQKPSRITQSEIPWRAADESRRIFLVRIAVELIGDEDKGAVLTFDDISELQSAQRKAAWADVARRIAHEIKNPLTPIQLSAERLKRKYLSQIKEDPEIFSKCTDTIIHHVGDIGRMVNEFSAFARMPEPIMRREKIMPHLRDLLVLQQQAHTDISMSIRGAEDIRMPVYAYIDGQQLRQAFTNIIQNAVDSIHGRMEAGNIEPGIIDVMLHKRPAEGEIVITVTDNGLGLPKDVDPNRLTEPYVTHREKGTGLGLAIVKKVMEDHKGRLVLGVPEWLRSNPEWKNLSGASVSLVLPEDSEHMQGTVEESNRAA